LKRCLVGFYLCNHFVQTDKIAILLEPGGNRDFGNRLTNSWHDHLLYFTRWLGASIGGRRSPLLLRRSGSGIGRLLWRRGFWLGASIGGCSSLLLLRRSGSCIVRLFGCRCFSIGIYFTDHFSNRNSIARLLDDLQNTFVLRSQFKCGFVRFEFCEHVVYLDR